MPNFRNAKIYKIFSTGAEDIYIGSTCATLRRRLAEHKCSSRKHPDRCVYVHFNTYGVETIRIELIENYPCSNKKELCEREQYYIDLLKPTLNSWSAHVHCPHGRKHSLCKDCGGVGICEHGKEKYRCAQCGGFGICQHRRQKRLCVDCNGSQTCKHRRQKKQCVDCNGVSICEHKKHKHRCKQCLGDKYRCNICNRNYSGKQALAKHMQTLKHLALVNAHAMPDEE